MYKHSEKIRQTETWGQHVLGDCPCYVSDNPVMPVMIIKDMSIVICKAA